MPDGRQGGQGLLVTVALVGRERRRPGPLLQRSAARPATRPPRRAGGSSRRRVGGSRSDRPGPRRTRVAATPGDEGSRDGRRRRRRPTVGSGRHLVDAAHAVDGHVLDQEILLDQAILLDRRSPGVWPGAASAAGPPGRAPSSGVDGLSSMRRVMAPPGGKGRQNTGR